MDDLPSTDQSAIEEALFGKRPKALARFFLHGAKNEDRTIAEGYPVFENREYVEIRIPDEKDFVSRPALAQDRRDFPQAYALFERVRDWKQHSLELLPGITAAELAMFNALGLFTIERVASHDPENPPWKRDGEDMWPTLNGHLPKCLLALQSTAKRFMGQKPRLRLINGILEEVA